VLATILAIWVWLRILQLAVAVLVSILLAVALEPAVHWLERRRFPRWLAAFAPVLVITAVLVGFIAAASSLTQPASMAGPQMLKAEQQIRRSVPFLDQLRPTAKSFKNSSLSQKYSTAVAQSSLAAMLLINIGLILTVYLLIERERTEWAMAFVPPRHRAKARQTAAEAR